MSCGRGGWKNAPASFVRKGDMNTRIKDLATIQTGYQFRGKIEPVEDGTHRVIQPKDIDDDCRQQGRFKQELDHADQQRCLSV